MHTPAKKSMLVALSCSLALVLGACGGASQQAETSAANTGKDPITQGKTIIWEQDDKEWSAHQWESEDSPVAIGLDDDGNGVVTDVMFEVQDEDSFERLLSLWTERFDSLDFAVVYDDRNSTEITPQVRVCFYGLEDAKRAKAFVDACDDDIFAVDSKGLLDNAATIDRLHEAGYKSVAEMLQENNEELVELSEEFDALSSDEDGTSE